MSQNPQKYAMLAYREQQSRQPNHEFLASRGQDSQIKQRVNLSIAEQLPVVGGEFTVPTTDYRRSQLSGVEQPAVAPASSQLREKSSRNLPKNLRGRGLSNRPDQPITNEIRSQLVPKQSEVAPTGTAPNGGRPPRIGDTEPVAAYGATYGPFKHVNKNFRGSHVQMFHDKTGWNYDDVPYAAPGTLEQSRTENEHSGYNWSQFDDVNTFEKQYSKPAYLEINSLNAKDAVMKRQMTNEMQGLAMTSRKMSNKEAYQLANLAENKPYNDVGPHGQPHYNAQGGDRQFGPAPQNSMQVTSKRELTRGQVMSTDRVIGAANGAVLTYWPSERVGKHQVAYFPGRKDLGAGQRSFRLTGVCEWEASKPDQYGNVVPAAKYIQEANDQPAVDVRQFQTNKNGSQREQLFNKVLNGATNSGRDGDNIFGRNGYTRTKSMQGANLAAHTKGGLDPTKLEIKRLNTATGVRGTGSRVMRTKGGTGSLPYGVSRNTPMAQVVGGPRSRSQLVTSALA